MARSGGRRAAYWVGVLVAVVLLVGGAAIAYLGYVKTSGPAGAVRGFFAALARSDAPGALAFGDLPDAPHPLLTSVVLREQQSIAPLRNLSIVSTHRHGAKASVAVSYTLAFPGNDVPVHVRVPVHESHGDWRLDRVAIPTELQAMGARQRETIAGTRLPTGQTMFFPGALPIRLDTPYLQLDPLRDNLSFDAETTTGVYVEATDAARAAMLAAVRAKLQRCLGGTPDSSCPLPDDRFVPSSVHGRITGSMSASDVDLDSADPAGRLEYTAGVAVSAGYRKLDFHNRQIAGRGQITLAVKAAAYAVAPLTITWTAP